MAKTVNFTILIDFKTYAVVILNSKSIKLTIAIEIWLKSRLPARQHGRRNNNAPH